MNLLKTTASYLITDENENTIVRKVIRRRCKKFGLVPFDNFNEALDHNDTDKLIKAMENGLLAFSRYSSISGLRGMGWIGAVNTGRDALPAVIETFYNALKEGRCDFLTKEYAENHTDIVIGLMHLAISDYNAEAVKILLKLFP